MIRTGLWGKIWFNISLNHIGEQLVNNSTVTIQAPKEGTPFFSDPQLQLPSTRQNVDVLLVALFRLRRVRGLEFRI